MPVPVAGASSGGFWKVPKGSGAGAGQVAGVGSGGFRRVLVQGQVQATVAGSEGCGRFLCSTAMQGEVQVASAGSRGLRNVL